MISRRLVEFALLMRCHLMALTDLLPKRKNTLFGAMWRCKTMRLNIYAFNRQRKLNEYVYEEYSSVCRHKQSLSFHSLFRTICFCAWVDLCLCLCLCLPLPLPFDIAIIVSGYQYWRGHFTRVYWYWNIDFIDHVIFFPFWTLSVSSRFSWHDSDRERARARVLRTCDMFR